MMVNWLMVMTLKLHLCYSRFQNDGSQKGKGKTIIEITYDNDKMCIGKRLVRKIFKNVLMAARRMLRLSVQNWPKEY